MAKQLQLTIPTPCHENWDNMTPVDKGRFCGSCQKQVVDFSGMSDRQVAEFFKKPFTGSVCGRFMNDQLDRNIEIPKKRIPWVKYFFQFAIPAFLVSIKASAQKTQGKIRVSKVRTAMGTPAIQSPVLKGDVDILKCSKPLMGDTVIMQEVVLKSVIKAVSKNPEINLTPLLQGKIAGPVITVINKTPDITSGRDLSFSPINIASCLEGKVGGVVVVAGGVSVKRTRNKEKKSIPLLTQLFKDTASKLFKIFPNPVPSGSNLTIEWKQTEEGYYTLQLLNQSGQSVHQQEIWIDKDARMLNINVPPVAAGSYFIVLANKKSGKKFTEKIVIQ
jgi:Secretion system C-terminal sorting domain